MSYSFKTLLVVAIFLWSFGQAAAAEPGKYALLVGVGSYGLDSNLKKSKALFAETDASAVGQLLKRAGYEVDQLLDEEATRSEIQEKLGAFPAKGANKGVIVIGLFGHGVEVNGVAYFCPHDAKTTRGAMNSGVPLNPVVNTLVPMTEILKALQDSPAENRFLLADCCRKDPYLVQSQTFLWNAEKMAVPEKTGIFLASSKDQQALQIKEWEQGGFAKCLIEEFERMAEQRRLQVTAQALSSQVVPKVKKLAQTVKSEQTPFFLEQNGMVNLYVSKLAPEAIKGSSFRDSRHKIAAKIATAIRQSTRWTGEQSEIILDEFKSEELGDVSAAPGIQQELVVALQQEFANKGVTVKLRDQEPGTKTGQAQFRLSGQYASKPSAFELSLDIAWNEQSASDVVPDPAAPEELHHRRMNFGTENPGEIVAYAGGSVLLPSNADKFPEETRKAVEDALKKPQVVIADKSVKSNAKSPYSVQIQSRKATVGMFTLMTPQEMNGRAMIPLQSGDEYEIVIKNDSDQEVGSDITIDGLNVFAFSELRQKKNNEPQFRYYIIPAQSTQVLRGWHKRNDGENNYARFLVKEYGGPVAGGGQPVRTKVGVITVAFGFSRELKTLGTEQLATYPGAEITQKVTPLPRVVSPPHDIVSLQYSR